MLDAAFLRALAKFVAQLLGTLWSGEKSLQQRAKIEPCAAAHNRQNSRLPVLLRDAPT